MEIIIFAAVIIALAAGAIWFYNRDAQSFDINKDGKVDVKDAVEATKKSIAGAAEDSRDARDAVLAAVAQSAGKVESAARRTKTAAKKAVSKSTAKTAASKKTTTRKPK
jgi:hypothetical protein